MPNAPKRRMTEAVLNSRATGYLDIEGKNLQFPDRAGQAERATNSNHGFDACCFSASTINL
jgi:hypothetical protein